MEEQELKDKLKDILNGIGIEVDFDFTVEHPNDLSNGDFATNIAIIAGKKTEQDPIELANKIISSLNVSLPKGDIKKVEVAGPGFINIYFSDSYFEGIVQDVINQGASFGKNEILNKQQITVEFTDPNPFKKFHIGHMMSMIIGESMCKIAEENGAEIKRAVYQGDVGMHVAKSIWGMVQNRAIFPKDEDTLKDKIKFIANAYTFGAREFDADNRAKQEITATNKMIYQGNNHELNIYFEKGRAWSLEDFEIIYKRIGTKFDLYFLESEVAETGKKMVNDGLSRGIFELSDGAIIYKGEKHNLHTRVFINSEGLPTYETKELGLAKIKFEKHPYDRSIILTGNEQDTYFKVLMKALEELQPDLANKTTHLSHGMLRLPTGKMSSRTGDVIPADKMINEIKDLVISRMDEAKREYDSPEQKDSVAEQIAMGAIKYSILKQAPGKDVIFTPEASLSFDGDSGPYLQYTAVRARSILAKARTEGVPVSRVVQPENWEVTKLEKIVNRYPEVIVDSHKELAPHHLVTYLTEVASEFNKIYGENVIVDTNDDSSPYRVGITQAALIVLENGVKMLGMEIPEKM